MKRRHEFHVHFLWCPFRANRLVGAFFMISVKLQTSQRFVSSSNQHPTPASKSPLDILKTSAFNISLLTVEWRNLPITHFHSPLMSVEYWIFEYFLIQLWGTQKWKWLIGINMSVAHWNLCQLSWQQMVQCPVWWRSAEGQKGVECWMLRPGIVCPHVIDKCCAGDGGRGHNVFSTHQTL